MVVKDAGTILEVFLFGMLGTIWTNQWFPSEITRKSILHINSWQLESQLAVQSEVVGSMIWWHERRMSSLYTRYSENISYFSQLHLASGGKGQKWKPRVIQQSSGKFFYSRPFWTWKCIYKWLVPFPFLLWGEVGPKTARMCQCVSHLVTFLSLHSRKLTNIVPEKWWFLNSPLLLC